MCWSLEVSLATSAVVAGTVGALLLRGDRRAQGHAIFLGVFGSMQLVDAFLWADNTVGEGLAACSMTNRIATRAGLTIICLEPLAALLGAHRIAGTRPSAWALAAYASIFLLTPLAGGYGQSFETMLRQLGDGGGAYSSGLGQTYGCLFDLGAAKLCTAQTGGGHLLYGGMDILYRHWISPLDAGNLVACEVPGIPEGTMGTVEIPVLLRLLFLTAMVGPYATLVRPLGCGAAHASILIATWMVGFYSDAHASVWCLANVAQAALMLAEPAIWPGLIESDAAAAAAATSATPAPALAAAMAAGGAPGSSAKAPSSLRRGAATNGGGGEPPKPKPKRIRLRPGGASAAEPALYRPDRVPEGLDAVVVGSGIGGLTLASLLSKAGKRVLVLEQHYRPGGCTHAFTEIGGNVFDSGIHYVGGTDSMLGFFLEHACAPGHPVTLAAMGSPADGFTYDAFDLGDEGCASEAGLYTLRRETLVDSLVERFQHEEAGIREYIKQCKKNGKMPYLMLSKFVAGDSPPARWLRRALWSKVQAMEPQVTAAEKVARYVEDPALRAVLSCGQMIDWNLPPDEVSWLVASGMMMYYEGGGWYPAGNSNSIAASIIPAIEASGGAVLCKASVAGVETDPSTGAAVGVRMSDGAVIRAPTVVSAAGFINTFERLLSPEQRARAGLDPSRALSALDPSHSHVCAYVSLDGSPEELGLKPWNIHSMPALAGEFEFDAGRMCREFYADPLGQEEPLITLTCPAAKDPLYGAELPGRSNVLLLAEGLKGWFTAGAGGEQTGRHGARPADYKALKAKFEPMFLRRLYRYYPQCEGRVTHVELSTPLSAEHFIAAPQGASYGLEWTPAHFDEALHEDLFSPKVKGIPGLYLTGEAVAFGGFYGALATGYATAAHVLGLPRLLWVLANDPGAPPASVEAQPQGGNGRPAAVAAPVVKAHVGATRKGEGAGHGAQTGAPAE